MSIDKIKQKAKEINLDTLIYVVRSSGVFGASNPSESIKELFKLIDEYKEPNPKVDTPPKPRRTRRSAKKEETTI